MDWEKKIKDMLNGKNKALNNIAKQLGGGTINSNNNWEKKIKRML